MQTLSKYFAEKSLLKIRLKLNKTQQPSLDNLISLLNDEGKLNFNQLREALFPLASTPNSANTMLGRFLDRINEAAKESGMIFTVMTTANKKASDDRWVWFEGLAESAGKPYSGDLSGIPDAIRMEDPRGIPLGRPVVLITFNEHETRAVLVAFSATNYPQEADAAHTSIRLGIHGNQEVIHVISRQGRKFAQQTAKWAIDRYDPIAVIGVGIAFGVKNDKRRIGDVLVADYIFDYEIARLNADGSTTFRGPRPAASSLLVDRIRALDQRWGEQPDWPKVHFGPMVCGDKLVDNHAFIKQLQASEPECIGGEMEGAGIEVVASEAGVNWAVIKGISDWGDGTKNSATKDEDQKSAARNAAQVVKALLDVGVLQSKQDKVQLPPPAQPPINQQECRPPSARAMGLHDLRGVPGENIDGTAQGLPARLDGKRIADTTPGPSKTTDDNDDAGKAVLPYLRQWLQDPLAPSLFALLGEYGMGKTIICQLLAEQLDEERKNDPTLPIPLYFDLRHVTGLRERVPKLHEALEECMSRGWINDGNGEDYTLANIHRWVKQGAIVIFDGLDEVLVKLTEADGKVFTDNLLKLIADSRARAKAEGRILQLKILITCRTQYFPTLQAQNNHFTQSERGEFSGDRYKAMVLLPWSEEQVRRYLSRALPDMNLDSMLDMISSVHNLQELTERPYTLKLISEFIPDIESDRASGIKVYGVTLYRKMAEKWLSRDSGKHHIKPEHKLRLAANLAAHLWRTGRNALAVEDLNAWFHKWIQTEDDLHRRYSNLHSDQLEEDLRTATFLARKDDAETSVFRFAHTSLLEFFLARYLFAAVERNDADAWAIPVPSRETLTFLGQLLAEAGTPNLLQTLQAWRNAYAVHTSELLLAYSLQATKEGWPHPALRGMDLRGAHLRGWVFKGKDNRPLDLTAARFDGADLRDCNFRLAVLDKVGFNGANLSRINMLDCSAREADFQATELTASIFRNCQLEGTIWLNAQGYRAKWLNCTPSGAPWLNDASAKLIHPVLAPTTEKRCDEHLAWLAPNPSNLASFSPFLDSKGRHWIASVEDSNAIGLFDIAGDEPGPLLRGHDARITWCTFAPAPDMNGQYWLASSSVDGSVRLWNALTGKAGFVFQGHVGTVQCCAFASTPDATGRYWLASSGEDGTVRLWDTLDGTAGTVFRGHDGTVNSCAFATSPDPTGRHWLASAGSDGTMHLWDVATGEIGPILQGHDGPVNCCAFAPIPYATGQYWLATAGDDCTLRLWDTTNGTAGPVLRGHSRAVSHCTFAPIPDSKGRYWLASSSFHDTVRLWDAVSGEPGPAMHVIQSWSSSCSFGQTHDGSNLPWLACTTFGDVHLWDVSRMELTKRLDTNVGKRPRICVFSHMQDKFGRHWLASTGAEDAVRLWDVASGKAGPILRIREEWIWSCVFIKTQDLSGPLQIASVDIDGAVWLSDVESEKSVAVLPEDDERMGPCAFSQEADEAGRHWLVSGSEDGTMRLWDLTSKKLRHVLSGHEGWALSFAFASRESQLGRFRLASTGSDGTVRLWDTESGDAGHVFHGHEGPANACAFSSRLNGSGQYTLASGGMDGTVRLWNSISAEVGPILHGHHGAVLSCTFAPAPDHAGIYWLASAGDDGTVRLWNAENGEPGPIFCGHDNDVRSCAFSVTLDGSNRLLLASGSGDGTIRLWDVDSAKCLRITALCGPDAGHAVWEPETDHIVEVKGDAWRHLAWQRPVPDALPDRLPLETFGLIPYEQ